MYASPKRANAGRIHTITFVGFVRMVTIANIPPMGRRAMWSQIIMRIRLTMPMR
jgi:hypothetical protein